MVFKIYSEENNALEAISNGAVNTTEIVWAITANLIVFLALLAFVNNIIGWFGAMIGFPQASFEVLCLCVCVVMCVCRSRCDSLVVNRNSGAKNKEKKHCI